MANKSGNKAHKVLLAGGGTAGHVEPALAVARWIQENLPETTIEFLGTSSGLENHLVPQAGFTLHKIVKAPMPRSLNLNSILWPIKFLRSLIQTWNSLKEVDLLVGFGGYVSSAAYIVSRLRNVPIIAHEANAVPGWANKLASILGGKILISFEYTRKFGKGFVSAELVGIPLRQEIVHVSKLNLSQRQEVRMKKASDWGLHPERPIVVVFGGSLGSQHINQVISQSAPLMASHGIQVVHAVGRNNPLPEANSNYKPVPYFDDLPQVYCAADLIICRSGAVTCHELMAVGSFALLVPLAVGNGEQRFNAQPLVNDGAATLIDNKDFTNEWLSGHVLGLISAGKKFNAVQHESTVPLNAANRIGELISQTLGRKG